MSLRSSRLVAAHDALLSAIAYLSGPNREAGLQIKTWQEHTQQYDNRVRSLLSINQFFDEEAAKIPGAPLSFPLTEPAMVKYQMCLLVFNAGRSGRELCESIHLQWMAGRFLRVALCPAP